MNGSDRGLLGACARLEQADKATLLFGIADTDADEALTLEEFYTVSRTIIAGTWVAVF